MAFEDRCSPQSAPSPPGIPHSPTQQQQQSQPPQQYQQYYTTSSATGSPIGSPTTDMSLVSGPTAHDDRLSPPAMQQQQQHHHHHQHHIKQEPQSPVEQPHVHQLGQLEQPAVRFSISNILSDTFGKGTPSAPATQPAAGGKATSTTTKVAAEKKSTLLFRPYDTHISRRSVSPPEFVAPGHAESLVQQHLQQQQLQHHHHQQLQQQHHHQQQQHAFMQQQVTLLEEMRLAQFRLAQQQHEAAVLDFSRAAAAAAAAAIRAPVAIHAPAPVQTQSPPHPQPLLFNTFNMQSYPKIHEEIMNGARLQQQQQQQQSTSTASVTSTPPPPSPFSDSSYAKIPPLGNLCKTVSQIGQPSPRPVTCRSPTSSASSSSASSTSVSLTPIKADAPSGPTAPTSTHKANKKSAAAAAAASAATAEQRATSTAAGTGSAQPLRDSGMESSDDAKSETSSTKDDGTQLWPAWVYCTRYSDRPSSGPRYRKPKVPKDKTQISDEKRPRTAFSSDQLARLKREFIENRYLTERRRQQLSAELGLNEAQIKIWFQNKRAKIKKTSGNKNPLALQLMAQGLYNHSTVPLTKEEEELEMRMNGQIP